MWRRRNLYARQRRVPMQVPVETVHVWPRRLRIRPLVKGKSRWEWRNVDRPKLCPRFEQDVARQMPQGTVNLKTNLGKGVPSSTPSSPSPRLPPTSKGKYLMAEMEAHKKQEQENRAPKTRAKANVGKQKTATKPSSYCESSTSTSNESAQPPLKAKATPRGKGPMLNAPMKATPKPSTCGEAQ